MPNFPAEFDFAEILLTAPSRLHFGLLRVGQGELRFGGAGVMIDRPPLVLHCRPAEKLTVEGPLSERVRRFVETWTRQHNMPQPPLRIFTSSTPPQHSGLGVGTQLGLSVAAVLNAAHGIPQGDPQSLAQSVGRGRRSAVGAYGFHHGGLIIERGKGPHEELSPLELQIDLPSTWRFLLVRPRSAASEFFGEREQSVFDGLTARPDLERELEQLLRDQLAPAAAAADFAGFADAVQRYGRLAGSYFEAAQGGPYNGPLLNQIVAQLQSSGARGVGQSSWGPTLFCCCEDAAEADELAARFRASHDSDGQRELSVSAVSRTGAVLRRRNHSDTAFPVG